MNPQSESILSLVRPYNNVVALRSSNAVAPAPELAGNPSSGIATLDWDLLFDAVTARLGSIADALLGGQDGLLRSEPAVIAQAAIQECVAALQQLHGTLTEERRQQLLVESELAASGEALALMRVSLLEAEALHRSAQRRASLDSLTKLPNRGHFIERSDTALAALGGNRRALAALYIDLDDFKAINDLHGHHIGDQVLQIVAARLVFAVRADDIIGRLGGDEFACLLTSLLSKTQLELLAGKLVAAVSAPMQVGTLELVVHASIGIAIYPSDGETSESLLHSADGAMYSAKRNQSGHAFVEQRMPLA